MPSYSRLLMPSDVSCRHSTTASWKKHEYKCNSRLVTTVSGFNKSWLLASNLNVNVYRLSTTLSYDVLLRLNAKNCKHVAIKNLQKSVTVFNVMSGINTTW